MMSTIDESKLRITVESSEAKKNTDDLTKSLNKNTKAGSKNSDQMKESSSSAKSLAKMITGVAVGYGALKVIKASSSWLKESTRLTKEQETATARLESIARGVTKATEEEIDALKDLADAQQQVSTFGDEVIETGLSQILSFGTTAKEAGKLTDSLADLIAANVGIDATGKDAINAANMFGKVLDGQTSAMTRAGVVLDDRQKKLIQEGDQATRVNALIEIMDANYGGLAKTLAQTDAGKIKQAENALGDMREEVGEKLLPAIVSVKEAQVSFYEFILGNEGTIVGSITSVANAVSIAAKALDWMLFKQKASNEQWEKFNTAQKQFVSASAWIKKDAQAVEDLNKKRAEGIALTEDEQTRLKFAIEGVQTATKWRDELVDKMDELSGAMDANFESTGASTASLKDNTAAVDENADAISRLADEYGNMGVETEIWLNEIIKEGAENAADGVAKTRSEFNSLWFSVDKAAQKTAEYTEVVELLEKAQRDLGITAEKSDRILKEYVKSTADEIEDVSKSVAKAQETIVGGALDTAGELVDVMGDQLEKGKADWASFAAFSIKQIGKIIMELVLLKAAQGIAGGIAGSIGGGGSPASGGGDLSGITAFADGTVIGAPTTFAMAGGRTGLMGEAGPEAIMPLKRGSDGKLGVASSGGGESNLQMNFNIAVPQNANAETAQALRDAANGIAREVKLVVMQDIQKGGKLARATGRRV